MESVQDDSRCLSKRDRTRLTSLRRIFCDCFSFWERWVEKVRSMRLWECSRIPVCSGWKNQVRKSVSSTSVSAVLGPSALGSSVAAETVGAESLASSEPSGSVPGEDEGGQESAEVAGAGVDKACAERFFNSLSVSCSPGSRERRARGSGRSFRRSLRFCGSSLFPLLLLPELGLLGSDPVELLRNSWELRKI